VFDFVAPDGSLVDCCPIHEIRNPKAVYAMQSIGYRAWMDEAEKDGAMFSSDGVKVSRVIECIRSAETCRTWTPTAPKSS